MKKFANKVKLPFGYLFLDRPPEETLPIPYYRTLEGETSEVDLNVRDTILMLQKRQEWLMEYFIGNDYDRLELVGKFNEADPKEDIIRDIRATSGLEKDWARSHASWQDALKALSEMCEEQRIILVFNSVVGNNTHRPIPVKECRGFVLVDEYAPFMFINSGIPKRHKCSPSFMSWHIYGLGKVRPLIIESYNPRIIKRNAVRPNCGRIFSARRSF